MARGLKNFESRATLLCLAEDYEKLSQHAERWDPSGAPVHRTRLYG